MLFTSVICQCAFPCFSYCEWCCYELWYTNICLRPCFHLFVCLFFLNIYLEVGLLGHMGIVCLIFLRTHHTVFHRGFTVLHFHKQCMRVPVFPPPGQYLLSYFFFSILYYPLSLMHSTFPCDSNLFFYCFTPLWIFFFTDLVSPHGWCSCITLPFLLSRT